MLCWAVDCPAEINPKHWLCKGHTAMVQKRLPAELRRRLDKACKGDFATWRAVALECVEALAALEFPED